MAITVSFSGQTFTPRRSESVLECLEREGVELPSSCRSGVCQSCMVRAVRGHVPETAQKGLKETLRAKGMFLACLCRDATANLEIELPGADSGAVTAVLHEKQLLTADIVLLRFKCLAHFDYHPGQFINLSRHDGLTRSYSIASLPDDGLLELHVRKAQNGQMSRWLYEDARIGEEFQIRGPNGDCFYTGSDRYKPMLLIGTGTGLAPLIGITRQALRLGHKGPITLLHGGRRAGDLYKHAALLEFEKQFENFTYRPSALENNGDTRIIQARLDDDLRAHFINLKNHQAFLCGDPKLVKSISEIVFKAGIEVADIYADSFVSAPAPQTKDNSPEKQKPRIKAKLVNFVAGRRWIQKLRFSVQALVLAGFFVQGILYYSSSFKPVGNLLPFVAYDSLGHLVVSSALIAWAAIFILVMIFGRFVCGWMCPFGFFQDAGEKLLRAMKVKLPKPIQQPRAARYILLALVAAHFVIMPLLASPVKIWQVDLHFREPWLLGFPFYLGLFLFDLFLVFFVMGIILPLLFGPRPYCKLVCETGILLDQSSKLAVGRIRRNDGFDRDTCLSCMKCSNICPQGIQVQEEVHLFDVVANTNCIACLQCVTACPNNTIIYSFKSRWRDTGKVAGYMAAINTHAKNTPRFMFTGAGVVAGAYLGLMVFPPSYFHTYLLFASLGGVAGWLLWRSLVALLPGSSSKLLFGHAPIARAEYEAQQRILPLSPEEKLKLEKPKSRASKWVLPAALISLLGIGLAVYALLQFVPSRIADITEITAAMRTPEQRHVLRRVHFGVPPVASKSDLTAFYNGFSRIMSKKLDKRVEVYTGRTYAEIAAGIENGSLDFAFLPPMTYLNLQKRSPDRLKTLLQMELDGQKSYVSIIVSRVDGPKTLHELKGRRIGFTQLDSLSGYIAPLALLANADILPMDLGERVLAGDHTRVLMLLKAGEVDAAATNQQALDEFKRKNPSFNYAVLATMEGLPADLLVANSKVAIVLQQKFAQTLKTIVNNPDPRALVAFKKLGITGLDEPDLEAFKNLKEWAFKTNLMQ